MLIIISSFSDLLIVGENNYQQLGSTTSKLTSFTHVSNSAGKYDKVALGEKAAYVLNGTETYITGQAFIFEGASRPNPPFARSPYLSNFNIKDVSTSIDHAIALDSNGNVHTMGSNSQGQLARSSSSSNSAGQATLPSWTEPILQVGAVKSLSYIVYPSAIFMVGKCESCLCGNNQAGNQVTGKHTSWIQLNLTTINNVNIKKVYFGQQQIVVQMTDQRFYYIGKTQYNAGCKQKESFCTPELMPFNDAKYIFLSANLTAIIKLSNEIHYCGCYDPSNCTNNPTLTKFLYSKTVNTIMHQVAQIGSYWYVVENDVIKRCIVGVGSPVCQRQTFSGNHSAISAISAYGKSAIAYTLYRYMNVKSIGDSAMVNIELCGQQIGSMLSPFNQSKQLNYTTYPYNSSCFVSITGTSIYRIVDQLFFEDVNATHEYKIIKFPQGQQPTEFPVYLKFQLENGQQLSDTFDVSIISVSQTGQHVVNQSGVTAWTSIQLPLNSTGLYDKLNFSITTPTGQTKKYQDSFVIQKITELNQNVKAIIQPIQEKYFLIVDQSNGQPISGVDIEFYYQPNPGYTLRSTETSNATGYITLSPKPGESLNGFNLVYRHVSNGSYNDISYQWTWVVFDASTTTIQMQASGAHITVSVTHGKSGTVELINDANVSLINISFPTSNLLSLYQKRVRVDPSWNVIGQQVTGRYTDSRGTYYAPDISQILQDGVQYNFQVSQAVINARFHLQDQNGDKISQHTITVSQDDNVSSQNYISNNNGNVNVSVNLIHLPSGVLRIWADAANGYAAFPEATYNAQQLAQKINIQIYKFVTFNVSLNVVEGVTGQPVQGIDITVANSNQPNNILLRGSTNMQGHVEFIINETDGILAFRENYVISFSDPRGKLAQNTKNMYLQNDHVQIDIRMNASRIVFQVLDTVTNKIAQGAQLQIQVGQQSSKTVSDQNGIISLDITGTFTQGQLYYQSVRTDIYKVSQWKRFQFSLDTIVLNVESWLNMTLKLDIVDGSTNAPLDNMNISIYTDRGILQYNEITTQTGRLWLNFSEREGIIDLHTVYNLSIVDTLTRYKNFNVNFSVETADEATLVPMDLQRLLIIVTNYEVERVGNVTIDLMANKELLQTQKTNALGIALFYLQEHDYLGKELTYFVYQSEKYRPKGPMKLQIKSQPQNVIRRVFPLVIYNFTFNLSEKQNESQSINLNDPKYIRYYSNSTNRETNQYNVIEINEQYTLNSQDLKSLSKYKIDTDNKQQDSNLPEIQIFNFTVSFYDENGQIIFNTMIEDIYDPTSFIFVENINQSFQNNRRYKYEVIDNTNVYYPIKGSFKNVLLSRNFNLELSKKPPETFQLPWWGYILILSGVLAIAFLIYAIKRLLQMKKSFRKVRSYKGLLLSEKTYYSDEQQYIKQETDNLNQLKLKKPTDGHIIVRHKLMNDNLNMYNNISPGDNNIIQNAQILLKAKLQSVQMIK